MFLIVFMFYGSKILFSEVIATTSQPSIYDKFSQSDYKLKFEHLDVEHYNKGVIKELKIVTFKHNRTFTACNGSAELKIDLNNDLEVIIQAYKFTSNEYRLFPLRLQVNGCHAFSKNIIGIRDFIKCGNFTGCPLKKNIRKHVCNWSIDESRFPPFIPTGRFMLEIQLMHHSIEVAVVKGYGEVYRPIYIPN